MKTIRLMSNVFNLDSDNYSPFSQWDNSVHISIDNGVVTMSYFQSCNQTVHSEGYLARECIIKVIRIKQTTKKICSELMQWYPNIFIP